MATINPNQDYDLINTLTFAEASGTCNIRLYRGSTSTYTGTVYYRAGTSGSWTSLSVLRRGNTFPVSSTTMQVAHNWNKSGNNYMTPSFQPPGYLQPINLKEISISQKAPLSGTIGDFFMVFYANNCSALTSLGVPDTSGVTSVGTGFMGAYASGCSSLTSLDVPETSSLTSVGNSFMNYYASDCSSLTTLNLPSVGYFKTNDVDWRVPSSVLGTLKGYVTNSADLADWQALTDQGETLYTNYIRSPSDVVVGSSTDQPPGTSLTTPADNATLTSNKPTLTFSATDPEREDVSYEVQVSTSSSFTSTQTDALSATDTGFSGSDPYASGASVSYTLRTALTEGGIDYYWRVRAKDPSGSGQWGEWSGTRSFQTNYNGGFLQFF
jgi:hypothetical protein